MPLLSFGHFNLKAAEPQLRALRDFYVDVVGLHEGWRPPFDFPGHWLYLGEQAVLHLVGIDGPVLAPEDRRGSFDHVAFNCRGLAETQAALSARGVPWRRSAVPGTAQVQLFLKDPAGNGVELNFDGEA